MSSFVRFCDRLSVACAVCAAAMLFTAAVIVGWMVLWRATGHSSYWELESAVYLMVAAVFLGSPYCLMTGGHVGVDLLGHYASYRWRRVLAVVVAIGGLAACLYLAWIGAALALESAHQGERTGSLWNPPRWPLYLTMPLGLGLTALQYLAELARLGTEPRP